MDRFCGLDPQDPEFESLDEFEEFLIDNDQTEFDHRHLQCLNFRLGIQARLIRRDLEDRGLTLKLREVPRSRRGHTTSSHDRWFGPGASRTHGGSGWEVISGFAGQAG